MVTFKKFNTNKDRGKVAETATQKYLDKWHQHPRREYSRLVDTKAAGRIIKAAAADFEFFCENEDAQVFFGLLEVKQTEHDYRLARDKVPQFARMRKRANCGGTCIVLVYHSTINKWRALDVEWMTANGDKGSWNLTDLPSFATAGEALNEAADWVFN